MASNVATKRRPQQVTKSTAPSRRRKSSTFWNTGGFDVPFLVIVLALITIGLIMMFSASYTYCYYNMDGDSLYYFKRQLFFAVVGIVAMFVVSRINYEVWKVFALPMLAISVLLLIIVLIVTPPAGYEDFHRWISLGPLTFQPSEVAKFGLILYLAWDISQHYIGINTNELSSSNWAQGFNQNKKSLFKVKTKTECLIRYILVIALFSGLVYKENHVSGAIVLFSLGFMMLWLAGYNYKWFLIAVVGVAVVAIYVINNPEVLPSHAQSRITAWLDKDYDPLGVRWQTNQATYAIGSGGLFGVGLGNSTMKQLYVSEPQNDFIFSIVVEELGIVGAFGIMALFILLVWRGFVIGIHAKDKFGSLLAMGLVFQVGLQTALNIAVVTDTFPNTGISLPFFSYGGTSLLMLVFEMGIILSISRSARLKKA